MRAFILSVGDELVLGQTVDTNSGWISQQLAADGCDIVSHRTVGDDQDMIVAAVREAAGLADVLIISGGIGPTEDDLTRQAIAEVLGTALELNCKWLQVLETFFKERGRPMPPSNCVQAMIPVGASMLHNPAGTAAGIDAAIQSPTGVCRVFSLPGVPKEMKVMFDLHIRPFIRKQANGAAIFQTKLNTFGMGESAVAEQLGDLMHRGRNPSVGTTVAGGIVSLRINARFPSREEAERQAGDTVAACQGKLGNLIFGQDEQSLAEIVGQLLIDHRLTVTTAESCTGGLLAKMLTDQPGSSAYFKTGFITYANSSKYERLGVNRELLGIHGAVSEPVVEAMVRNALKLAKANVALAISGIAGPDGGTPNKPVGTVCIALASAGDKTDPVVSRSFNFPGDRETVRDRSAKMALAMLRFHLLGEPPPF